MPTATWAAEHTSTGCHGHLLAHPACHPRPCAVDGGKTWTHPKNNTIFEDALLFLGSAAHNESIVALGAFDLFVSNDNGEHWFVATEGTDVVESQGVFSSGSTFVSVGQLTELSGDDGAQAGMLVSEDRGHHWKLVNLTSVAHSIPRYGAAAGNNWFIASGTFPDGTTVEVPQGGRRVTSRVIAHKDGVKFTSTATPDATTSTSAGAGWSAELLVSHDRGASWKSAFHSTGDFYFNEMDCGTPSRCCAAGEADTSNAPGIRIWCTQDAGSTWQEALFVPNGTYSLTGMTFLSETEAMAVGGVFGEIGPQGALQYHTTDGGKTWTNVPIDVGALDFFSADFPVPSTGYGVGLTALQTTSELKYT